jgi:DNA-3-methyladenine glycosylase II
MLVKRTEPRASLDWFMTVQASGGFGPFSLDAVRELQCGFLRGSRACPTGEAVRLAFPSDRDFSIVGATLELREGQIEGRAVGTADGEAVGRQVARVLAVDCDARPFAKLLERDPALREVAAQRPGFRPVVSYSPYVMGGWAILSQRIRMAQAAGLQIAIAEEAGDVIEIDGDRLASFPRPQSLLDMASFPGIPAEKWSRLQGLARAALDGALDLERLIGAPYEQSRERLMSLRGVGPWTADGILMRGCGLTDALPLSEPSLHSAVELAYGLPKTPDDATVAKIAEDWRPFRTWVSVLLISHLHRSGRSLRVPSVRGKTSRRPTPR